MPVSCHFRDCKPPLSRIVSGAISNELPLPFYLFYLTPKLMIILVQCSFAVLAQKKMFNMVTCTISVFLPMKTWIFWYTESASQSSKNLWERSNTSIPTGTTHVYRNAVPSQKYLREHHSHTFPHHYTPAFRTIYCFSLWRWSLPLPINPVWWGSMHTISSYRGNRPTHKHTNKQTNPQTGPITIHCAAA